MGTLNKIIAVWLVSNILFIPGFKSLDLLVDNSQHVCVIQTANSIDNSSNSNEIIKEHCENCEFFVDDTFYTVAVHSDLIYIKSSNSLVVKDFPYYNNNIQYTLTRAPPKNT